MLYLLRVKYLYSCYFEFIEALGSVGFWFLLHCLSMTLVYLLIYQFLCTSKLCSISPLGSQRDLMPCVMALQLSPEMR